MFFFLFLSLFPFQKFAQPNRMMRLGTFLQMALVVLALFVPVSRLHVVAASTLLSAMFRLAYQRLIDEFGVAKSKRSE